MKITQGVKLHNRFDITVTDIRTGKVRQVAEAENVVTNYGLEQISQFSSHWYRLLLGKGAGTPAVTDVSLFDYIGYALHSNSPEYVRDYENNLYSKKREYLLYPEDFIGETITEVGLSCNTNTNSLSTHAMLKDAEGNPISITKGEFDQVSIFATVFYEFLDNPNGRVGWAGLPNHNNFLEFLFGTLSGSWYAYHDKMALSPSKMDVTRKALVAPFTFMSDSNVNMYENIQVSTAKTCVRSSDVAQKKLIWTAPRYNTGDNNDIPIFSLGFGYGIQAQLPIPGVWEGVDLVKDLNTGDGANKLFVVPDLEINSNTLVVKIDGAVVTNYTKRDVPMITRAAKVMRTPHAIINGHDFGNYEPNIEHVKISGDGKYVLLMAVDDSQRGWRLCKIVADNLTLEEVLHGTAYYLKDEAISHTGKYFAYCEPNYNKITVYMRGADDSYTKIYDDLLGVGNTYQEESMQFTPDEQYFVLTSDTEPFVRVFKISNDGVFTQLPFEDPDIVAYAYRTAITQDAKYVATTYNYVDKCLAVFEKDAEDNYTFLQYLSEPAAYMKSLAFTDDGQYLIAGTTSNAPDARLYLYKLVNGLFVLQDTIVHDDTPDGLVAYGVDKLFVRGNYIFVQNGGGGEANPNPFRLLTIENDHFKPLPYGTSAQMYTTTNTSTPYVEISADTRWAFIAYYSSSDSSSAYMYMYHILKQTQIEFDTPPAQDAVVTAEYHTDAIPKDDNHVLDVTWEIVLS